MEKKYAKIKDKWYYYKLIAGLYSLFVILWIYFYHIINRKYIGLDSLSTDYPFNFGEFQFQFLSYFTIQSNILVCFWFFYAAITNNKKPRFWLKQNTVLAITTYITVTMITYMMLILPFQINKHFDKMNNIFFFESFSQHLIVPILMIIYTICNFEKKHINIKTYLKSSLWKNLIYPTIYFVFIILRFIFLEVYKDTPFTFPYIPPEFLIKWIFEIIYSWLNNFNFALVIMATIYLLFFSLINGILFITINLSYVYFSNAIYKRKIIK